MRGAQSVVVAGLALLVACGDDDASPPADAGPDAGPLTAPPAPPAPPAWVCPPGWRTFSVAEGVSACDPWPEGGRATCPDGEAHFPGEPGCALVGHACPADGWPVELPEGRPVRYVRAGAPPGGDGTRDAPHAAIEDAFFAAAPGTVVAVAPGVYDEMVEPPAGFALVGACASGTTVGSAEAIVGSRGRITVNDGEVEVRDLTIVGSKPGLWVEPGGALTVRDVIVEETTIGGITVLGALDAERLVVRRVQPAPGGVYGRAIHAEGAATQVALRAVVIEQASEVALFARGASIELTLEDVAIVDTLPQPSDDQFGTALIVAGGARATMSRVVVERAHLVGVSIGEAGTSATAEHLVVRDVDGQASDGTSGSGLTVGLGATATARGVLLSGNRHDAADAYMKGSVLTLEDAVILDTRERVHDGGGGAGAVASDGGRVELRRVFARGNHAFGLGAMRGGALVAEDVTVVDTAPQVSDGLGGSGIALDSLATGTLRRVRIDASYMVGLFAGEGTTIDAEDLVVLRTESQASNGVAGRGIELQRGARGTLRRATVESNRDFGLGVFTEGTELTASDLVVRGTTAAACFGELPVCRVGAVGVGVWSGRLVLTGFSVESNDLVGIELGNAGAIMLSHGRVAGHPIGLHAQNAGLDPTTQLVDVVFEDNDSNLDTSTVPIPEPVDPWL